jgi:hypothetical protein
MRIWWAGSLVSKSLPSLKEMEMMNLTFHDKSFTIQTNAAEEMVSTNAFKILFQILKPIIFKKSRVILKQILILNYSGTQSLSIPEDLVIIL